MDRDRIERYHVGGVDEEPYRLGPVVKVVDTEQPHAFASNSFCRDGDGHLRLFLSVDCRGRATFYQTEKTFEEQLQALMDKVAKVMNDYYRHGGSDMR